ncbi:MAG: hypothetical protein SF051_13025 [Elusimicrobiota bacterium]|nr:hypothetical protein [Elusimicrobiota bacterium]
MKGAAIPAEARALALPAAAVAAFLLPIAAAGLTTYWGDLTYLHQSWRASPAQLVQAGRAPLWEPSLYLGMPMLAPMQGGLLYPATGLFYCFGFATATFLFQSLHMTLAGVFAALWLRSLRLRWGACAAGGLVFALGGFMVSRLPFVNHLAAAAWMPALSLFFARPLPLAASLALMFLAGYPTTVPGACLSAWALAFALRARGAPSWARLSAIWVAAGAMALALSGAQLLPAVELAALSRRAAMGAQEILQWSFTPRDLLQWTSPLLVPWSRFRPEVDWWKCVYLGAFGALAALAGACALPRRRAAALGAWLAFVAALLLGGGNPVSAALWKPLTGLSFVRYPGNLAYLAWPALALLAAAGLSRRRLAAPWALLVALELVVLARLSTPTAPRGLFTEPGPLARTLQERLEGSRYLISPRALESSRGAGVVDWKTRLFGLTNAPYRLRAVGNFGEPLVPAPSYAVMDAVFSLPSADAAAGWMPWLGASRLLTPAPVSSPRLVPEGRVLWEVSALKAPVSSAYLLTPAEAERLPASVALPPFAPSRPLPVSRPREDELTVSGSGEGRVFLAEPLYPGWTAELSSGGALAPAVARRALGAFQLYAVPPGEWTLRLRYDPPSFRAGVALTLAALLLLGAYWYHRAPRVENL